ncbi:MAG: hypothetical protein RL595_361 [Planctomycetota bacterium]|jgi:mRNA interferase RelE/StbE
MAKFRVVFVKSAKKEFEKLPAKIQAKTVDALKLLAENPYSELLKVKKLKGADALYRIRLSDYRVVYEIHNDRLIILVIAIGHRGDVYRGL